MNDKRSAGFWFLAAFFALFVLFLYGPMFVIVVLSFQGPEGGLTFPLRGVSLHWFYKLAEGLGVVDIGAALKRSLGLGLAVTVFTVVLSVLAGLASFFIFLARRSARVGALPVGAASAPSTTELSSPLSQTTP